MADAPMRPFGRRAALMLPLLLGGCQTISDWLETNKPPIPGKRLPVMAAKRGVSIDNPEGRRVTLPAPVANADWPQAGGVPSHAMGHLAARPVLAESWHASIGEGGGYRRQISAYPVVANGRVVTMDSDGVITAYDTQSGRRLWRTETQGKKDRSTNIGGGVAFDGGVLYAATGRAEALALDAASGKILWRASIGNAARAAPTLAGGRLFIPTISDELLALSAKDGSRQWSYQASNAETSVLGLPSPAYADGFVVAGFASGELLCLRESGGAVVWAENLAATGGRDSLIDLSAIRGMPVIANGQVYVASLGGLMLALDLRSGRRLWERDIGASETMWLAGDWLFALSLDNEALAINRNDGAVAWITPLPRFVDETRQRDPIRWLGPILVSNRLILAGSGNVQVAIALDPANGKVVGRQELSGPTAVAPVVAGGAVYLVTDDATLTVLR